MFTCYYLPILFSLFTHLILVLLFIHSLVISNLHANAWPDKMQVFSNFLMPCTPKYDDLYFKHPFSIIFFMVLFFMCYFLSFEELTVVGSFRGELALPYTNHSIHFTHFNYYILFLF